VLSFAAATLRPARDEQAVQQVDGEQERGQPEDRAQEDEHVGRGPGGRHSGRQHALMTLNAR
jgi:hypothetical protein